MKRGWLEDGIGVPYAPSSSEGVKFKLITLPPLWPLQAGNRAEAGKASSRGCLELLPTSKSSANPATSSSHKEKTVNEGKLSKKLKAILLRELQNELAGKIEATSRELGEDHFAYQSEAVMIAAMDIEKFKAWAERVVKIKTDLPKEYHTATLELMEIADEQ